MQTNNIDQILAQRQGTHGEFEKGSAIEQKLKDVFRQGTNWDKLEPHKKTTLDMIAMKISRIVEGNSDFLDHWDDIIGYTTKTVEALEKKGCTR